MVKNESIAAIRQPNWWSEILRTQTGRWWISLIIITIISYTTRLTGHSKPVSTVWDEVHFGKFANYYINNTYYHDVHPPLGKMMVAGAAYLTGYRGNFSFDEKAYYPDYVNYKAIRMIMATMGATLPPLTFLTIWEISFSLEASLIAATCVLCDTLLHRLNTMIVLDPPLLAAIVTCLFAVFKFSNQKEWSKKWWFWLSFTGASLGTVMSIKYIGAFTVVFVGAHTAFQLFSMCCDSSKSLVSIVCHTTARVLCLIILPLLLYTGVFICHMLLLTRWVPDGGGFYHTRFFGAFKETEFDNVTFPDYVDYGANITILSSRPLCGYLESWYDLFPSELTAPCQQVTTATSKDEELLSWTIKYVDIEAGAVHDGLNKDDPPRFIKNGDFVMLTHTATERSLRTHGHRAPITRKHFQVCGYGDDGAGGPFETWQILIPGKEKGEILEVFTDDFMLKSYQINCYLRASESVKLPKIWSFDGAHETTCTKNVHDIGLLWHINWISSKKNNGTRLLKDHSMGMVERFTYSHKAMFIGNNALIPTAAELSMSARPWMWPFNYMIQMMGSYFVETESSYFVMGIFNPLIAYINVLCFVGIACLAVIHKLKEDRYPKKDDKALVEIRKNTLISCLWLLSCWVIHYLPFFGMARTLYIHHYCPAYIISCMLTGIFLAYLCHAMSRYFPCNIQDAAKHTMVGLVLGILTVSYIMLYPLATIISGQPMSKDHSLNSTLNYLYFGQRWPELGFGFHGITYILNTKRTKLDAIFSNPDVNATLHYLYRPKNLTTNNTKDINPLSTSAFASWVPSALTELINYQDVIRDQFKNESLSDADVMDLFLNGNPNFED